MKHTFALILITLATTLPATAQDTLWMSLDSCLRYAYKHNLNVQQSELNQSQAEVAYEGAKWRFAPSVNASASENLSLRSGNSTLDGNYGLNANMTLFNGFSNVYNLQSNKISQQQSELKVQQTQNTIGSQVISAYLTIVMNQERLQYQNEVLNTTLKQKEEGELKYKVGKLLESDYMLLQANYITAQSNIEDTRLTIENNQLALRQLLALSGNMVIGVSSSDKEFDTEQVIPTQDSVVAMSMRNLPDIRISEMDVEVAQLSIKQARANFLPTLGLSAGASYYGGNSNTVDGNGTLITQGGINSNVGLSLNIPILNRGTSQTQYKQSKIQLQQAQLNLTQIQLETQQKVQQQYLTTQQCLNKYHSAKALEEAYKCSYDVYVLKYGEGAITTVDMLQQQDKYLSALNDYLQQKYSYVLEERILNIYMGK